MAFITDPNSSRHATVSTTNRVNVSAKTADRIFYAARDRGLAFAAIFDDISAVAGDYIGYLKNTSADKNLFIQDIVLGGVENIKYKIFHVDGIASSGEDITPVGLNLSKNIPAEAIAMAGNVAITGLSVINQIGSKRSPANSDVVAQRHSSTMLGPGDAVAIEYDTGISGLCGAEIHFWYELLEDK